MSMKLAASTSLPPREISILFASILRKQLHRLCSIKILRNISSFRRILSRPEPLIYIPRRKSWRRRQLLSPRSRISLPVICSRVKVPANVITRVETPLNLVTTTLTSTGAVAPQQGGYANFIIPGVFSLLLALSLIFSSTYVLQSLGEEKENRLMEILLSSVSTRQLLTGKVLGLGAAGLVQVIVWVISLPAPLKPGFLIYRGIYQHYPGTGQLLGPGRSLFYPGLFDICRPLSQYRRHYLHRSGSSRTGRAYTRFSRLLRSGFSL